MNVSGKLTLGCENSNAIKTYYVIQNNMSNQKILPKPNDKHVHKDIAFA